MSSPASLTAFELLRRQVQSDKLGTDKSGAEGTTSPSPKRDIDDDIRRLEAELAKEGDSDSDSGESGNESSAESSDEDSNDSVASKEEEIPSNGVLSLSALEQERIDSLPSHLLPSTRKRSLKIDQATDKKAKKKEPKIESGLESAVKEVLSGYVARSSERLPFYCRVCQQQYSNEKEFFGHKATDFHRTAVEMERKASYCKLCKKQLTSPEQLKEHLTSRPHKERLERVHSKNGPGRGGGGSTGGYSSGRGFQGRGGKSYSRTNWSR